MTVSGLFSCHNWTFSKWTLFLHKQSFLLIILLNEFLLLIYWLNENFKLMMLILEFWGFNCQVIELQYLFTKVSFLFGFHHTFFWSTVFCSLSLNIRIIDCWLVFFCWSYKHLLILIFFLGYDIKLSVGCTQIGHVYLFPLQDWKSLWQGCRLGINSCWRQLISFLDLKSP